MNRAKRNANQLDTVLSKSLNNRVNSKIIIYKEKTGISITSGPCFHLLARVTHFDTKLLKLFAIYFESFSKRSVDAARKCG